MKAYKIKVNGTYKNNKKDILPFEFEFIVPNPNLGKARYFINRLIIAKMKQDNVFDFEYIYKRNITKTTPVDYTGGIIGKTIHELDEYEIQDLAIMHDLKAVPYYGRAWIDEVKRDAIIEYAKVLKPDVDPQKISEDFMAEYEKAQLRGIDGLSALPKLRIKEGKVVKVEQTEEVSTVNLFDDMAEVTHEVEEPLFEEVPYTPEAETVEETKTEETSASGMTKDELLAALKGLGVKGVNPNTGLEKLQAKYDEAIRNVS